MNDEEKLDELLGSKLSEREFPFDELNWDKAERLIIQQERRKKLYRFAFVFSAGLLAGIAIMLPFILTVHSALPNAIATKPAVNQNPATQNNSVGKEEKAPLPVQSAFVKKDTRAGIRDASSNVSPIAKTSKKSLSPLVAGINKNSRKVPAKSDVLASTNKKDKESGHTETITQGKVTNVSSSSSANSTLAENGASSNTADKTKKDNSQNTTIAGNTNSENATTANNSKSNKNSATTVANNSNIHIGNKDSNANSPPMLRTNPEFDDYRANILSVYAGGDYSFGWKNASNIEANGLTPIAGFTFTRCFNIKLSASIGVGYSELNKLNTTYTSSSIQYDFGQNANITAITPQKIYYMAFPLSLHYTIKNNIISAGIDFLWLLTTSSSVLTEQQTPFGETAVSSAQQNGYVQGFNNLDFQFTFAYTRMLTERLGIGPEFYLGINYIENSSFPADGNYYHKDNGFRLVVSYQLMK